jgi:kumamolisin
MEPRKVFHDSVTPLPAQAGLTAEGLLVHATRPEQRNERMNILFSFSLPSDAQSALEEKVAKGETISPDDLKLKYAPKAENVESLKHWLKSQSFTNIEVSKDGAGVYAQAPIDQIEKSLDVKMVRVTKGGLTFTAAQNPPSLPADVGAAVQGIIGLQPFRHAHKHRALRSTGERNRVAMGHADVPANRNDANAPPYLVREILKAYGADALQVTGAGQTIGILIDTVPSDSDVQSFWRKNELPVNAARVENVNVNGAQLPPTEGEETLDVEWASGIASGAKVKVYASGSLNFVDLDKALDRILADVSTDKTLRQVSISLGLGERFFGGLNGEVAAQHQKFLKLAALGVNVFVSSGDSGSNPDQTGHGAGPLQVEYESSDPYVVAVGGTSLRLAANGQVSTESAWEGSGGGKSTYFKRPSWQRGAGFPSGTRRLVPDVSAAADPATGAFVFLQGKVEQIGGTSWSAPVWAGFCALINEARLKANKAPLPFLPPLLYPLAGSSCFRDITEGTNGNYEAGAGYDLVTGLGTPNVAKLIEALTK